LEIIEFFYIINIYYIYIYIYIIVDRKLPHDSSLIQKGLYAKPEPNVSINILVIKVNFYFIIELSAFYF